MGLIKSLFGSKNKNENSEVTTGNVRLVSPLKGEVIPLSQVDDPAFASGAMGGGIAILPTEGKLYAPVDGTITVLFPTKHAIGIESKNSAEILLHVGINTVELNGTHFKTYTEQGKKVKKGELLVEFDMTAIKKAGYELTTPIIITNTSRYERLVSVEGPTINVGDHLMELVEK